MTNEMTFYETIKYGCAAWPAAVIQLMALPVIGPAGQDMTTDREPAKKSLIWKILW